VNALAGFDPVDAIAVALFLIAWLGHSYIVSRSPLRTRTLSYAMHAYRLRWMGNTVRRKVKIVDAAIQNGLQQGVLFFASTSILLIGALLAALGAGEQAVRMLGDLPFTSTDTRTEWEAKVLLAAGIFTYAFFKFAWSYRLFNYVIILIGAGPEEDNANPPPDEAQLDEWATRVGRLHSIAGYHFTAGIHAYFHALSVTAWFVNGWAFIIATVWVSIVLYRRAFGSRFLRILTDRETDTDLSSPRTGG